MKSLSQHLQQRITPYSMGQGTVMICQLLKQIPQPILCRQVMKTSLSSSRSHPLHMAMFFGGEREDRSACDSRHKKFVQKIIDIAESI